MIVRCAALWLLSTVSASYIPNSPSSRVSILGRRPFVQPIAGKRLYTLAVSVRGGDGSDSEISEDTEDGDDESEESDETEVDDEIEDDDETVDASDSEEPTPPTTTTTASAPLKVVITTGLRNPLVDQTIELTASATRTIASLKLSCFRQMRGKPPVLLQRLSYHGKVLEDSTLLSELLDDEEEDGDGEEELACLRLVLECPPPVSPKFAAELAVGMNGGMMQTMTPMEIVEAYAANEAARCANDVLLRSMMLDIDTPADNVDSDVDVDSDDEDEEVKEEVTVVAMRQHALLLKEQFLSTLPVTVLEAMESNTFETLSASSASGGAEMHVRRSLQKNLNINWPTTIRNFFLFIFFGQFGGRDKISRTLMLLGAPLCFVVQARPVKIFIKQLFYAVGTPPGILLSLLPAPEQAIMSLDVKKAMRDIYGVEENNGDELEEDEEEGLEEESELEEEYDDIIEETEEDDDTDTDSDDE